MRTHSCGSFVVAAVSALVIGGCESSDSDDGPGVSEGHDCPSRLLKKG